MEESKNEVKVKVKITNLILGVYICRLPIKIQNKNTNQQVY